MDLFSTFRITISILREINYEVSRSAKTAILPHLETLKFDFYAFFALFEGTN